MEEVFCKNCQREFFFLKWSQRYHQKTHPVPLAAKEGGNLYLQRSLVSAHSLFLQYFLRNAASHSQSLPQAAITPFLPYHCSSSTTCTKHQAQNQWFGHGGGCRLWSESWATEGKAMGSQLLTSSASKHPEQSLSPTETSFPCRGTGAAAEIGSANILGRINQLLLPSITCKEFCCISIWWSLILLLCNGLEPWSVETESHTLPNNTTKKRELRSVWVWRSKTPPVSNTTSLLIQSPAHV